MQKKSTVENLNGLIYERVYGSESHGNYGTIGMELHLSLGKREITEADKRIVREAMDDLREKLWGNTIKLNQGLQDEALAEKKALIGLFDCIVFVEPCKNEYSNGAWGELFPWYKVTTPIGRIKIGTRKRVINIDWSETTVAESGSELFPTEDVTKGGVHYESDGNKRYIHAWGLEKAKEYINKILDAGKK